MAAARATNPTHETMSLALDMATMSLTPGSTWDDCEPFTAFDTKDACATTQELLETLGCLAQTAVGRATLEAVAVCGDELLIVAIEAAKLASGSDQRRALISLVDLTCRRATGVGRWLPFSCVENDGSWSGC